MSLRRTLMLAVALAALAPGTAAAEDVRVVARDVSLDVAREAAARAAPTSFTMVGLHWQGPGKVWFRTAERPGQFGPWRPAQPEAEDMPDVGGAELDERAGWRIGNPWWTGPARWIQYRVSGEVTRLRAYFVDSPVTSADRVRAASSRTAATSAVARAGPVAEPTIVRRAGWGADETIVRGAPTIAERLRFAVVHHTAGSNRYSAAESAAIVRGIQRYHVVGNGWDDIGYNFLVDKYGRVFEGRGGGITQNVVGAHAGGFNTGSVGIAVIGIYESRALSDAARRAVQKLLAWRLDVGHVYPRGFWDAVSGGSSRWPAGATVRLRAISGHRDTSYTSCPGNKIYGLLGRITRRATRIGLPKLWTPEAEGSVGGPVRFTARLSEALPWTVQVKDGTGSVVASGNGSGTAVDWTWDASAVPVAFYTYTISAGSSVRPSTLPVPGPPPLAITGLKASPRAVTPNGDWSGESTTVRFGLNRRAVLGVRVVSESTGNDIRTLLASSERRAGLRSLSWDGRTGGGSVVPDGRYRIEVSAEAGVEQVSRSVRVVVDRTLGGFFVSPAVFSPNGDGRADALELGYELTRSATVRVQIRRSGQVVRTLQSRSQTAGSHTLTWNGRVQGVKLADGAASVVVRATTTLGTRRLGRPVELDTRSPVVRVLSLRMVEGAMRLRLRLSEPAELRVWYGRETWRDGGSFVVTRPAGSTMIRRPFRVSVVRIIATDDGLNRSDPVVYRRKR
ncbi:MAG TPA: FlgD immunoglobulin-like domain containing protein [Gaiellaceae bacterium]|nr:FlgD immunoglobulin-like domain containing protein [Gaiellaceae bacterium]